MLLMKNTLLQVMLLAGSIAAGAQINSPGDAGRLFRAGAMLDDGNYVGCIDQLSSLDGAALSSLEREQAEWLLARARAGVSPDDGIVALKNFLAEFAASAHRMEARMLLGNCLLESDPVGALAQYDQIDAGALPVGKKGELAYRSGCALLALGEYDKAGQRFTLARADCEWRQASGFYLGYIAYVRGDYAGAKSLLEASNRKEAPGNMADYYLAQIYYVEGDYGRALASAKNLLAWRDGNDQYSVEANRIAGESLFQKGTEADALPYLRRYAAVSQAPERSTLYILGTAEFKRGNGDAAVKYLEPVAAGEEDAMGQSACLFIGQALIQGGDNSAALFAFDKARKLNFDREVAEAAAYNYAVAKLGGGRTPFGGRIETFEEFLRNFPNGTHAPVAQNTLVSLYLSDQNYEGALASINRMVNPPAEVLAAKQKVLYALGTRALAAGTAGQAMEYLLAADELARYDSATAARVNLSLGEACYKSGDAAGAVRRLNAYLRDVPAGDPNESLASYDLGYARFALKDYKDAAVNFQKVVNRPGRLGRDVVVDALNRLGDTKYYTSDFPAAVAFYGKAYELNPSAGDYPLFQQAVIQGYQRDHKGKIATVRRLLGEFPTSSLVPDALLEMTESYIQLGDNRSALDTYRRLVADYPATEQGRRGYLQMALTQLNTGDKDGAVASYKEVVKRYPTSDEARMAIDELKRLSADDGTLGKLGSWLASVDNAPQLDVAETDRLTFDAAEKAWLTRNASDRLEQYLTDYPAGAYRARALGYLMDCADNAGRTKDALTFASEIVLKYPDSSLAENALAVKAAAEHSLGRGGDALRSWTALESRASSPQSLNAARVGIMRVARDLSDYPRVLAAADALLASSTLGSEERNEAIFSRALALDLTGKTAEARSEWGKLAGNTDDLYGAKSAFYLAESFYDGGDRLKARKQVETLIDSATPHTYWLARAFILLSDIYAADGKIFEAREYLNSLRDNYPGSKTDIFQMIDTRLSKMK